MKIGRVAGTVVSTINHPFFDGHKLLLCDIIGVGGEVDGYLIAVDMVDAGVGDTVLLIDEGNSSRQIFDVTWGPIRATIVGIVDDYEVA